MLRQSKIFQWGCVAALLLSAVPYGYRFFGAAKAKPVAAARVQVAAVPHGVAPPALDDIPFADAHARAVRTASASAAWGGVRTGHEPTLSDRVVDYRIEAKLDPAAHTITGRERLIWRNRSDRAVRSLYLHLYLNAFESEGSTFFSERRLQGFQFRSDVALEDGQWGRCELKKVEQAGAGVAWRFVQPDAGPPTDHTVVRLDLPVAVAAGADTTLDIDFFDQLPRVLARTGYFGSFHLVGQWFPKVGVLELPGERGAVAPRWNVHEFHLHSEFYADFGHYDVSIDVPEGYTVGATGAEITAPLRAAGRVVHRFVQGDVHDFAWTADKQTAEPLEGTYTGPGSPPVKVTVLFPPEYAASAVPALQATLDSLAYFSKTLGPYPYGTVTVVIPPYNATEAGGMEYPTFFTAAGYRDAEPDTLARYALDFVTIHEFGHNYFYGILGSNEFEEPMLDEGLNEFWDLRMVRERHERVHLTTPFLKRLGIDPSVSAVEIERVAAELDEPSDGLGANSWDRASTASFGSVYTRTAMVMRDLEDAIGRETLEKSFKAYYARWKFRHPSIADLRDVLVEVSGHANVIDDFFALHVYTATKVDDQVESLVVDELIPPAGMSERNGRWTELTSEQRDQQVQATRKAWKKAHPNTPYAGPFAFRTTVSLRRRGGSVPQTLVVKFADGSQERAVWDDASRWKRFVWVKPMRAVSAQLDPKGIHRVDVKRIDNGRTLRATGGAARRIAADLGALVQFVFALVAAL
jgi:hypothetical protein